MQSQMLLQRDELQSALDILTAIDEPTVAHALGTVATLCAIVQAVHADEPVEGTRSAWSLYQNAIAAWEKRGLGDEALGPILQAAAAFARKNGLNDACALTNERLVHIDSQNPVYRAALVQALATRDIDAAELHVQQLPGVGAVTIDAAVQLAAQGMPRRQAKAKAINSAKLAAADRDSSKAAAAGAAAGPSVPAVDTIMVDAAKVRVLLRWMIRVRSACTLHSLATSRPTNQRLPSPAPKPEPVEPNRRTAVHPTNNRTQTRSFTLSLPYPFPYNTKKKRAATQKRKRAKKKARDRAKHVAKLKAEGRWTEELVGTLNKERWLPVSQRTRSGVRTKAGRRKQQFSGGAQVRLLFLFRFAVLRLAFR